MTRLEPTNNNVPFVLPEPSIGCESYMHRAAKEVFVRWLREAAAEADADNYASVGALSWRVNRDGPSWGIWQEYPFTREDQPVVWDERCEGFGDNPPTPEWCRAQGYSLVCVADIAVQHKGCISAVVEIVHRHPVPQAKRDFYAEQCIALWEINAGWVMRQTKRPSKLRTLAVSR